MTSSNALVNPFLFQENADPEQYGMPNNVYYLRKYVIGAILTFRSYDPDEVATLGDAHKYTFQRGDKLVVLSRNGCGMGIDVRCLKNGVIDMVWAEEVTYSRTQFEVPLELLDPKKPGAFLGDLPAHTP